jgi:hypothetical protein
LGYIRLAWGGEEEQAAEIAAGNPLAKNWQREAEIVVEEAVRNLILSIHHLIRLQMGRYH